MSLPSALQTLANYRTHNTRASQDVLETGVEALKANAVVKMGDDAWAFLEQLTLAAIDCGRLDIADECLEELAKTFPGSTRVNVLTGIRMEASESPEIVLKFYDDQLQEDSSNAAIWKRRISVLRRTGKTEKCVEELTTYLDTFYNDLEGWVELADIYSFCNQYTFALQALSHCLLLAPQNPFYALQFAETAFTANDLPLALKMFLVVVDMCEQDLSTPTEAKESVPSGISVRAWYGVKLCCRRALGRSATSITSQSNTALPETKKLKKLDELATERVLTAYSASARGAEGKGVVMAWMGSNDY
ncbi:TPR-like protein [Dendrothele bispora CBS 962.96]|uniref:ER membrane protein complex subunit 2 n=1 Tax=Dendrothele bispora (strain CBS 962.96) TaxID=1314807 RepID=A0A4S8MTN2_DENBC|nr:TPR-like protein [Dendrothele bispora CBS 962.96]